MLIYPNEIPLSSTMKLHKWRKGTYMILTDDEFINLEFRTNNKTINGIVIPGEDTIRVGDTINLVYKIVAIRHSLEYQAIIVELKYEDNKAKF